VDNLATELCGPIVQEWRGLGKTESEEGFEPSAAGFSADAPIVPDAAHAERHAAGKGKLAPYLQLLTSLVESRSRAKIKDFHVALREQGYQGSYDLVKKKIHAFRKDLGRQAGQAFASPEHPQAQVEVGKILLKGGGRETRAYLFTMTLGHSGRFYAELLEACEMGRFLQAHQNAFECFGGVPRGVLYDPQESPLMRRLVGGFPFHLPVVDCGHHFGYVALPTPRFAPWMKGRLKRPAKILRKLFFPDYEFVSFEAANAVMQEWLARYARQNGARDRIDRAQREKLGAMPLAGFNFLGRRQFLKLRA
jgi:transposase